MAGKEDDFKDGRCLACFVKSGEEVHEGGLVDASSLKDGSISLYKATAFRVWPSLWYNHGALQRIPRWSN